jgi:enediyne polyketide synthase
MERRTTKRIPVNFEADVIWSNKTSKAFIVGISESGLYLITDSKDLIGNATALEVKFTVPRGEALELSCEVAWTDKRSGSLREMGLKIINPSPGFRKFYRSSYYRIKTEISHDAIAVIGMSCYYPGAADLKSFWENILARKRAFRRIPEQRLPLSEYYDPDPSAIDKTYGDRAAVIDGFEFDWVKRGIPKTVVDSSDIVHWLALDVALRALEDAGLTRQSIPSDRSGVILGNTMTGEQSRSQQMRLRWPYVKKVFTSTATQKGLPASVIDEMLGSMETQYKSAFAPITEDTLAGNLSNTIAGRICNFLDMHGGGYTVDGACSSSLIAVATAANALSAGTLDLAVAGGIDISLDTFELIGFAKTNALTREDMRVYDRRASGFIPGEGAGFVILKRLQDARAAGDYIYAVLRGWGVSSDGKGGMTAPKALTQALAIRRAYGKAGYGLDSVDFIEGHGTGTTAGDKAELEGIASAMEAGATDGGSPDTLRPLGVTSLKSLIGHTKAASGIGGFIKAVMAVNRRVIPPTAGCSEPNPIFDEKARGIYPVMEGEVRSPEDTMRAGVSGMGFGGINCHVTVESAGEPAEQIRPSIGERELLASHQETELFVLSAGSQQEMLARMAELKGVALGISTGEMVDLSGELTRVLSADKLFRAALVAGAPGSLVECLGRAEEMLKARDIPKGGTAFDPHQDIWIGNAVSCARLGFLFPGQGSQQLNMGRVIAQRYGWARELWQKAEARLAKNGYENIYGHIYRPVDRAIDASQLEGWRQALSRSEVAQPAICMTSLLWARHLEDLGIRPAAAGGHSLGELTAFHAAGAFDENTLLDFAAFRGRATSASEDNAGTMASFACDREKAEELLKGIGGYITIANVNSPSQTVVSGERPAVEEAVKRASLANIKTRTLPVSNAFHSRLMAGAAEKLSGHAPIPEVLGGTDIRLLTSMDGSEVTPGTDTKRHFSRQVTHPVDFISLVNNMRRQCDLLVEVGPGRVLSDLANSIAGTDEPACLPVESKAGDMRSLNVLLGCYFVRGGEVNWPALFVNRLVRPFVPASKRFFIENPCERAAAPAEEETLMSSVVVHESGPALVPSRVADEASGLFTRQQIDYIRALIKAEAQGGGGVLKEGPAAAAGKAEIPLNAKPSPPQNEADPDLLLKLASEMTGFPKDSITMEHRLLDDLNLDSIKAGQFAAKALRLYNAEGKQVDPTGMANSSIQEIYDRIKSVIDIPDETKEVKPRVTAAANDPDSWVRNFKVAYEERPRPSSTSFEAVLKMASEEKWHALIVSDEADGRASGMEGVLTRNNIAASSIDYGSLNNLAAEDYAKYHSFIFLLPSGKKGVGLLTRESVEGMVSRLSCIGKVITSVKTGARPEYAVVQSGSGGFYKYGKGASMEAKGSAAFLCSAYLENTKERIRVLEFDEEADAELILQEILQELHSGEEFGIASFDRVFRRHVPVLTVSGPGEYRERKTRWTNEDVVLVTGGAKGITAECALAFAKKYGVKLAIAGSTVLIHKDDEIQSALERYRENGIVFRYYSCDVSDRAAVTELKKQVDEDLGKITGVIHGAAVNRPRRIEQIDPAEALKEISPKLIGAINLCDSFKDGRLKLFAGFGSIIGVTGMAGNAWYGFSNEVLNLLLQQFGSDTGTEVITPAFSVWDEVGMGARMGSLAFLSKMGVLPVPREKGVERFMQLMEKESGEEQIVVSGRLGGLDTIPRPRVLKPQASRYLEDVLYYEKGIEIETKVSLTLERDPYLKDHVFRGSYLFPTAFGMEAMAQAVSAVAGIHDIGYLQLENIRLSLPITVEPDNETEIRIRALVEEANSADGTVRVKAGITVDQTGFMKNHFEATFIINQKNAEQYSGKLPEGSLDIIPGEDLYGHMLFQGSTFQRIKSVRSMDDRQCVFDSEAAPSASFITGDPYFRDTLLQSLQIILPDLIALPVEIEKWEIFLEDSAKGTRKVIAELLHKGVDIVTGDVVAIDAKGRVVEILHGYKAKIIENVQDAPRVDDLRSPDDWDETKLNARLQYFCHSINRTAPAISITHQSGFHEMKKTRRHIVERDLFGKACRKLEIVDGNLPGEMSVSWTKEGKPFIKESGKVGLSYSHDDRVCLCALGRGAQGCDIETLTHRAAEEWGDLLGTRRAPLLETIASIDKSVDRAGSRIWCALEALRKATDMKESELRYDGRVEDCLMFEGGGFTILAFPVKLLRGSERMVAIVTAKEESGDKEEAGTGNAGNNMDHAESGEFVDAGPRGQRVFACRIPLGLKDSSTVGGGVYFASYFHWLGKVRERALKPIGRYIAEEFHKGHFMVTNYTETNISGHVRNDEIIDARTWIDSMSGNSLTLHFEWRKLMPDRTMKPVAFSRHQVSWIRVKGHGVAEPVPSPKFFMDFLRDNGLMPKEAGHGPGEAPFNNGKATDRGLGRVLYEEDVLGESNNVMEESVFDTTMEHSNLAQNIYFSNYFTWQGHLRDRYLFNLSPEQYRKMDDHGQFACIHSHIEHLREAMPFDRISVTMKLSRLYQCGIELFFEYFKVEPDGNKLKLAYGVHTLARVLVDGSDNYVPQGVPEFFVKQILTRNRYAGKAVNIWTL